MIPENVLAATANGGTILVNTSFTETVTVLGSSVPISVTGSTRQTRVHSFAICPPENKAGIVAVTVHGEPGNRWKHRLDVGFLLAIEWLDLPGTGGGVAQINRKHAFVPRPDRLGQVVSREFGHRYLGGIEVQIDSDIYTTIPDIPDTFYVPDGDLLCQYLVGDVDADAVKAVAQQQIEIVDRTQELEKECQRLSDLLDLSKQKLWSTEDALSVFRTRSSQLREQIGLEQATVVALSAALTAATRPWYQRLAIRLGIGSKPKLDEKSALEQLKAVPSWAEVMNTHYPDARDLDAFPATDPAKVENVASPSEPDKGPANDPAAAEDAASTPEPNESHLPQLDDGPIPFNTSRFPVELEMGDGRAENPKTAEDDSATPEPEGVPAGEPEKMEEVVEPTHER